MADTTLPNSPAPSWTALMQGTQLQYGPVTCESYGASPLNTAAENTAAIAQALTTGGMVTLMRPGTYTCADSFAPSTHLVLGPGVLLQTATGGPVTTLRAYSVPMIATVPAQTLAIVGDSYTAQYANDDGSYFFYNADGYVTWALALSGQRLSIVSSPARSNSRFSAAAAAPGVIFGTQVDTAIASGANNLLIMGGVNDCFASYSLSAITNAYEQCLQKAIAAGMRIWACTQPTMNNTFGSYSATIQGTLFALNEWLREYVASAYARYGVTVVDLAAVAVDPSSATGNYKTSYTQDGLHPRNLGAYFMGKELARVWNLFVPEANRLLSSAADNYSYSSVIRQGQTNGLMTASAGGVATGLTLSAIAGGSSVNTIASRSDGFGNDQVMTITSAANNDGYRLESTTVHANGFASGDVIQAECEITVSSATNYRGEVLQLIANASVSNRGAYNGYVDTTNDTALTEGYTVVRRSPPVTLDGTPSSVRIRVDTNFSGAGGATVKVGRLSIRRLNV